MKPASSWSYFHMADMHKIFVCLEIFNYLGFAGIKVQQIGNEQMILPKFLVGWNLKFISGMTSY